MHERERERERERECVCVGITLKNNLGVKKLHPLKLKKQAASEFKYL